MANEAGFQKLEDFWNRDFLRTRQATALDEDASNASGKQLGLAEFSNGNFICEDALYKEYYGTGEKHYFAYPSLETGTDYRAKLGHFSSATRVSHLRNGREIKRIGIKKNREGVTVNTHSMLLYFGTLSARAGRVAQVSSTVNDTNVLQEYHEILIPKAVEYSAGILDYFFRGQIDLAIQPGTNAGNFVFSITNISSQDFLGGSFTLLKQDAGGTRTVTAQYAVSGTLAVNTSMDVQYTDTTLTTNTQLILVYQGTIGVTNGVASDPVDAGIALTTKKFGVFANEQFDLWKCWDWEWSYFGTVPADYAFSPVSVADANSLAAVIWEEENGYPPGSNCL